MLSGVSLDAAIGIVHVRLRAARGIKGGTIRSPNPYIKVSINNRGMLDKTQYKKDTHNPTWDESVFVLVKALQEFLVLSLFNHNDYYPDTDLGCSTFELANLLDAASWEGVNSVILKDGEVRGQLIYDVSYYPVRRATMVYEKEELSETNVGIVRLTVHQAKDLDYLKSLSGNLNPVGKLYAGGRMHTTDVVMHSNSPVWESTIEFFCVDKSSSVITLEIMHKRDILQDPVVGCMTIRIKDLLETKQVTDMDWWPLSGCKSGKVRLSVEWKPLQMPGPSLEKLYLPPIGVVRLWIQKATDVRHVFRNDEATTLKIKSDQYVRVQINNVTRGRTDIVNSNSNPEWNEIIYIPVHSLRECLHLECMNYQYLNEDRFLGSFELRVNELAKENEGDIKQPYESIGKNTVVEPIHLGCQSTGQLHVVAEFMPALVFQGVAFEFESDLNKPQDGEGSVESGSIGQEDLTEEIITSPAGVAISREELLTQQSGVIVFNVISGQLYKKARLEVLMDDGYWPAFTTVKARSTNAQWQHIGESFVKELDFGRVWLRLNENDEGGKDNIIAEWKGDAKAFLQSTLSGSSKYTLEDNEGRSTSTVEIETRYVPVPVTLEPRESINNQGVLRIDLLGGKDILAADRGGTSDPFAVFSLNGQKVFKSQTKKKTLNPEWNESFVVSVHSRVGADFTVEVFDWNQVEQAKSLGTAKIELSELEPFLSVESVVVLALQQHRQKGEIRMRLIFQPEIITKAPPRKSTFSAAGRAMTQLGGLSVGTGESFLHEIRGIFGKKEKDFAKPKDE